MGDAGVGGVGAEAVFLIVGAAEDVVACALGEEHEGDPRGPEAVGVGGEVAGLEGIDKGEPDEVAEGEHEAEAVGGDIDGGEHGGLHVEGVEDVDGLEEGEQEERVG